jgi:lipopolysaccharide transport system permease protein
MTLAGFDRRDLKMLTNLFRMTLGDRFQGSALGLTWAVLSPVLLMAMFCFVFTYVFPGRLANQPGTLPFIVWLLSGYGPWLALSEGLSAATTSVVASAGIIKNVAFKSELVPVVGALTGLIPLTVALTIILLLLAYSGAPPSLAWLVLPYSTILLIVFVAGAGLFLGALNVFVRDTALALPNLLTLLLFASPIFYPLSAYPAALQNVLVFNPFYVLAECFRAPLLNSTLPPLWMLIYMTVVSGLTFVGGLWWFRRLKSFFDTRL